MYYDFHPSIANSSHRIIEYAMGIIEKETCLKFQFRTHGDRIQFTNGSGCSSFVGRLGRGSQRITLGKGCYSLGIILHEILHALGMWHEQSRPDRDDYIRVISDNIKPRYRFAFQKRNLYQIDYHGEGYDYESLMHYSLSAFRNRSGLRTIEVTNEAAYIWQGRPKIGGRTSMSESDITQLNRMYNCPGSGVPGTLQVLIKNATNLNAGGVNHRMYVLVTAVDDQGANVTKTTNMTNDTTATWNELIDFGGRVSWQYVTISVWSVDAEGDSQVTRSQAFSLSSGFHKNLLHCSNSRCTSFVDFDFNLKLDRDECNPNPCRNNGTCHDLISSFSCDCPVGYTGPRCQYGNNNNRLRVFIRNATNLPNRTDGGFVSPYVNVIAFTRNSRVSRTTYAARRVPSPQWNFQIDFGVGQWYRIRVRVSDWDRNRTPRAISLSKWTDYFLDLSSSQTSLKLEADSGYVLFDYHLEAE